MKIKPNSNDTYLTKKKIGINENFDRQDCSILGKSAFSCANTFFEAQFLIVFFE